MHEISRRRFASRTSKQHSSERKMASKYRTLTMNLSAKDSSSFLRKSYSLCWSLLETHKSTVLILSCVLVLPLMLLTTYRLWATIFPELAPFSLDVTVPAIWGILSFLCVLSVVSMLPFLNATRLATKQGCSYVRERPDVYSFVCLILRRKSIIVAFLLTTCSVGYNGYLIWFVYTQWSHDFPLPIQLLEALPTVALGLQSPCQGCCLLFATACPVSYERVKEMSEKWFIRVAYFHMFLNIVLSWHPVTMVCIALWTREQTVIMVVFELFALLEVTFRIYSIVHLHTTAKEKLTAVEMEKSKVQVSGRVYPLDQIFNAQYAPHKNLASGSQEAGDKLVGPHSDFPMTPFGPSETENASCARGSEQDSVSSPEGIKQEHPQQSKATRRKTKQESN